MSVATINIPLDEALRSQMEDVLREKEISVTVADNMLRKMAFLIVQQKNAMGLYSSDTDYLSAIPGMKELIMNGIKTPVSECIDEDELWSDV